MGSTGWSAGKIKFTVTYLSPRVVSRSGLYGSGLGPNLTKISGLIRA